MSDDAKTMSERDEIELLLPWYATGRLDRADHDRVESYLAGHPEMRSQLELIDEDRVSTVTGNEAVQPPRSMTVDRIMAAATRGTSTGAVGWTTCIRELLAMPTAGPLRFATAAAALVILVQGVAIGTLMKLRSDAHYQTASGSGAALDGSFAIVRFAEGASAKAIAEALAALDMTITDGPKPGGLFTVKIGPKTLSAAQQAERIASLQKQSGVISLVMPLR
jgi:anti-sigma factor RsiW